MDEVATVGMTEPAGRAAAGEAREILERLGARVLLAQLDRLTAASTNTATLAAAQPTEAAVETTA